METFIKYIWPIGLKQRPNELSQGGFFYSGESDKVTCFYCGGGLQNWDPKDGVWEEHAKWWPKCGFLILNKSTKYIESFHSPTDFIHEENTLTKMYLSLLEFFKEIERELENQRLCFPQNFQIRLSKSKRMMKS